MRLGPQLSPQQMLPDDQCDWVAHMCKVTILGGEEKSPIESFADPGADSTSLHCDVVGEGTQRFSFHVQAYEGDIENKLVIFEKVQIWSIQWYPPFPIACKRTCPVHIGCGFIL